jgi:glycosyltransferase involved in cell wall biosynthesis
MPKVSVLMNCFNGAQFLKEAINSVYAQTYSDWEIIFIDNCSTDESQDIANLYNSKIKVFKTDKNIPLGAARNFGIEQCSGKYITFLDTDDIWLPNAIEKFLTLITSGDYAVAYAGHLNINADNEIIGKMVPKKKKGMIFGKLLKQFDIPIVASMVSSQHLLKSGLLFDKNIYASEEYCLFMQLSVKNRFIADNEFVTKYRIHDNALTNKTAAKWAYERRYTLDKIIRENPDIRRVYQKEFNEAYARASYYEAQYFMSIKDTKSAINSLGAYKYQGVIYFILYILIRYFSGLWYRLQKIKYGRKLENVS